MLRRGSRGAMPVRLHFVCSYILCSLVTPLLSSWSEEWSEEHGRKYFWEAKSGEASWRLPPSATLGQPLQSLPANELPVGWRDCTEDAASLFSGGVLQRAWRRMARELHPDKGGSSSAFQAATESRDYLKSPLRYFAFSALHDTRRRHPLVLFEAVGDAALVRTVRPTLGEDADGWPRLTLEASLEPRQELDLGRAHVWRVALAHADASTIEYKGDSSTGGYDVCCHFLKGSRCELRSRDSVLAMLEERSLAIASAGQPEAWYEQREAHYLRHDCPLPGGALNISVHKPLHLKAAGRWSVVLLLTDGTNALTDEPPPTACIAALFTVRFAPRPPRTAPPAENATAAVEFEQLSSGHWCRDGVDVLEGRLDSYSDCNPQTGLCQLTRKCRARCSKRPTCRYYTTYASGLCQLSSVCRDEAVAHDKSARTFAKQPG